MAPADYFPPDYFAARERFRRAAAAGWTLESHPIAARGPGGEELSVDVAVHGDGPAALVISSGVHGPEGPFGSAVQLALLDCWRDGPPVRVVLVHAVNPFGYAWVRRMDEQNVDPNRNFLPPGEPYAGAPPGYAELDPLLNPTGDPAGFPAAFQQLLSDRGRAAVLAAVAPGQYQFPRGLFFGGTGPGESHRLLVTHLPRWLSGCTRATHLDYHTGLGARGEWLLLLDRPPTPAQAARLTDRVPAEKVEVAGASGHAYPTRGSFGTLADRPDVFPADSLYACAEFGTADLGSVLTGLVTENRAWHHGGPRPDLGELFSPNDAEWQAQVLAGGLHLAELAAGGLM